MKINKNSFLFLILLVTNLNTVIIYEANRSASNKDNIIHTAKVLNEIRAPLKTRHVTKFRSSSDKKENMFSQIQSRIAKTNINISVVNEAAFNFGITYANYDVFGNLHQDLNTTSTSHEKENRAINVAVAHINEITVKVAEKWQKSATLQLDQTKPLDLTKVNLASVMYVINASGPINSAKVDLLQKYLNRGDTNQQTRQIGHFNVLNVNKKTKSFAQTWYGGLIIAILVLLVIVILVALIFRIYWHKLAPYLRSEKSAKGLYVKDLPNTIIPQDPKGLAKPMFKDELLDPATIETETPKPPEHIAPEIDKDNVTITPSKTKNKSILASSIMNSMYEPGAVADSVPRNRVYSPENSIDVTKPVLINRVDNPSTIPPSIDHSTKYGKLPDFQEEYFNSTPYFDSLGYSDDYIVKKIRRNVYLKGNYEARLAQEKSIKEGSTVESRIAKRQILKSKSGADHWIQRLIKQNYELAKKEFPDLM